MHHSKAKNGAFTEDDIDGMHGASAICAVLAAQLEVALDESRSDFISVMRYCIESQKKNPNPDILISLQYRDRMAQRMRHVCKTLLSFAENLDQKEPADFIKSLAEEFSSIRSIYSSEQAVKLYAVADRCCETKRRLSEVHAFDDMLQSVCKEKSVVDTLDELTNDGDLTTEYIPRTLDTNNSDDEWNDDTEWF